MDTVDYLPARNRDRVLASVQRLLGTVDAKVLRVLPPEQDMLLERGTPVWMFGLAGLTMSEDEMFDHGLLAACEKNPLLDKPLDHARGS